MVDQKQQPMITVKKADGTTERISLVELRARQGQTQPSVQPAASQSTVSFRTEPQPQPRSAVQPKPVVKLPQPPLKPASPKLEPKDFTIPLDEMPISGTRGAPRTSQSHDSEVDEIIGRLSFKVPAQFENRLRSIIQLCIKDIRGDEDTRELALRSIKDGGLGLTEGQIEELMRNIHFPPKAGSVGMAGTVLPMVEPEELPSNAAPFNAFVHKPAIKSPASLPGAPSSALSTSRQSVSISANPAVKFSKPQMNDIISPPKAMGPLQEIQYFTLTDFRRLSDSPAEAASRLWQKFINLKEESILLYFEAIKNWHESPLYREYLETVCVAIEKKQKLASVIGDKSKIQLAEIQAIIEMEQRLE